VRIGGKDFYLGRYGSKQARAAYARLIGEVEAVGQEAVKAVHAAIAEPTGPTVAETCLAFVDYAEATYRKNGRLTSTCSTFRTPVRVLRELYGSTPAKDFSPVALESVRSAFVKLGLSRGVANTYAGHVRRIFRWAVGRNLVPVSVVQALECLDPIRAGRTDARECGPVLPVDDATIEATLPYLSPVVKSMVRLQRLTGMRPGEVCSIRPCDIDRTDRDVWTYRPAEHKTMHKGRARVVHIGPQGQEILLPYLLRPATACCFSPTEAVQAVRDERHERRQTPQGRGNEIGTNRKRKPVRPPGERYDAGSYRRAIWRACEQAFGMPKKLRAIPPNATDRGERRQQAAKWREANCWSPNQLRHTAATAIRGEFGLEAVQAALGHAHMDTSQIYAEKTERLGRDVAKRLG
jgi:integrase